MHESDAWSPVGDRAAIQLVFAGYNYQQRQFADFSAWESQNWFGLSGVRPVRGGHLAVDAMISLEPFSVGAAE